MTSIFNLKFEYPSLKYLKYGIVKLKLHICVVGEFCECQIMNEEQLLAGLSFLSKKPGLI